MGNMCFNCKHQYIFESSYEWIDCRCKVDGEIHSPYSPNCDNYEKIEEKEEEE